MIINTFLQDIHLAKRCYDMAAETNADAKVPVALALMKLSLLFSMKYLQEVSAAIYFLKVVDKQALPFEICNSCMKMDSFVVTSNPSLTKMKCDNKLTQRKEKYL
jgi:hypothetical protein